MGSDASQVPGSAARRLQTTLVAESGAGDGYQARMASLEGW
jgi:hypothetical protein